MKYVLLLGGTMEEQADWDAETKEKMKAAYAKVEGWFEEHARAGTVVSAHELRGPDTATTVTFKNGKPIVTDGPFIEAKEVIGGVAGGGGKNLDEALGFATDAA